MTNRPFQSGERVLISTIYLDGRGVQYDQPARIMRPRGAMPSGYHRVRFDDGGMLLVHETSMIHDAR